MAYSDPLVVKIPLPENVDPDWIIKLSDEENPGSPGFNAGAYLGFSNIVAWMGLSNTILGRIPHGHSIQPATMENPFRHVSRALLPGESFHLEEAVTVSPVPYGDILYHMVSVQKGWWDSMNDTLPPKWAPHEHPVWQAWAQQPDPKRLWYVAIRRTLPSHGIPEYYFPEAELRF